MELFVYILLSVGILICLLCLITGIIFCTRKIYSKTEIKLKYWSFKTSNVGLVLIFIGLIFFSSDIAFYLKIRQYQADIDAQNALINELESEVHICKHEIGTMAKDATDGQISKTIIRLAKDLQKAYDKAYKMKKSGFKIDKVILYMDEYVKMIDIIDDNVDNDKNGHKLYYKGEISRLQNKKYDSHKPFYTYIEHEKKIKPLIWDKEIGKGYCYDQRHGYCRERTAWILHLMANDFYELGLQEKDANTKKDRFIHALDFAREAIEQYPPKGFYGQEDEIPTEVLKNKLEQMIDKMK